MEPMGLFWGQSFDRKRWSADQMGQEPGEVGFVIYPTTAGMFLAAN